VTVHFADFGAEPGLDFGADVTLFAVLPAIPSSAAVATAISVEEHVPGTGVYRAEFEDVAAGTYLLRAIADGVLRASWFVEFAGDDGEIVLARLDYEQGGGGGGGDVTIQNVVAVPRSVAVESADPDIIVAVRGDTLIREITYGSIVGRTKLWWTCKSSPADTDDQAVFLVTEEDGLVRLNGAAAPDSSKASLVVTDEETGAATLTVAADLMAALVPGVDLLWDGQALLPSGNVQSPPNGTLKVRADITRATS
jgi:hypothetical protein